MTNEEAIKILIAKRECMKLKNSGIDVDCNNDKCEMCSLCYDQGTMGEQVEALGVAIEALEKQIPIKTEIPEKYQVILYPL